MKIRALKAFTIRDSETGNLTSIANGGIAEVSDTLGSSLISDGLAEAYTLISPTGSIEITSNGTVDVADYASATVNVPDFKNLVDGSITEVTADMLAGVTSIKVGAVAYCSSLENVTIPDSVTNIGTAAFGECNSLTSVIIGSGVTNIEAQAFGGCSSLASVTIGSGITNIGDQAFLRCPIESLTIQATTPPTLGSSVFAGAAENLQIYVPAESVTIYQESWNEVAPLIHAIPS